MIETALFPEIGAELFCILSLKIFPICDIISINPNKEVLI